MRRQKEIEQVVVIVDLLTWKTSGVIHSHSMGHVRSGLEVTNDWS